jgi:hypothetical protein
VVLVGQGGEVRIVGPVLALVLECRVWRTVSSFETTIRRQLPPPPRHRCCVWREWSAPPNILMTLPVISLSRPTCWLQPGRLG